MISYNDTHNSNYFLNNEHMIAHATISCNNNYNDKCKKETAVS